MQKPSKLAQIPQIRFAGFTGDWERRKLELYANFLSGNGLNWNDISDNGEQECILYGNLYTDYGMIANQVKYKTNTKIKNPVYSKFGDVLIPASDTTPTGLARATCLQKENVLLGNDINIIRPNENINGSCLSLALNANKSKLICLIKGTTVRHIHNSDIKHIQIALPSQKAEQQKIGELFANLDNLITLHQSKFEKLQKIKKSCLQNLFPQNNQSTPKIRFKNFSDEWENKFLWEISSNIYQPQTIQETDFTKFGYDVYGANGIIGKYHSYNHELAQIAIACRGNSCGIVNLTKNKVWITGNAMVINVDSIKNINKIFLYFYCTKLILAI